VANPIMNRIGAVFIPVSDIEKAREWYCQLLGTPVVGDIQFGHLYVVPMAGETGLVLDSKIYGKEKQGKAPLFHFNAADIEAAYRYVKELGAVMLSGIEHDHWFTFKDPDGNVLMVCKC